MRKAASPLQLLIKAWYNTMQATKIAWLALKVDPVKGRPKPPQELFTMGVVELNGAGQMCWSFALPAAVRAGLARRLSESGTLRGAILVEPSASNAPIINRLPSSLDDFM